jgi:hypothetical protein
MGLEHMSNRQADAEEQPMQMKSPNDGVFELDPKIQDALGRALKAHYDDLVSAPIPDRFLVLLAELEAKERKHGG